MEVVFHFQELGDAGVLLGADNQQVILVRLLVML